MRLINVPLGWFTEVCPELCLLIFRIFAAVPSILDAGEECGDCEDLRMLMAVVGIACAVGEGNPVPARLSPTVLFSPDDVFLSGEDAGDSDERPTPVRKR